MKIFIIDENKGYGKSSYRRSYEIGYFIGATIRFIGIAAASFCVTKAVMFLVSLF